MKKEANTKKEVKIDASGMSLGRVATVAAMALMGKTDPSFERNTYSGFPVVVTNASKIKITQKKLDEMFNTRYSGYPGGLRVLKGSHTVKTKGFKELVRLSIVGMLPKNKLKRQMEKNLTIEE